MFVMGAAVSLAITHNVYSQDGTKLSAAEFEKLMVEIDTPMEKPWRQIPWKISLLEAQQEAAESQKPIFIWAMDGHPLGCT